MAPKITTLPFKKIAHSLEKWFQPEDRELPWRQSKDPYKVWISEIMLQQTTTQVVRGYYKKFITKWPTVKKLSEASIDDIYLYWQGLGYYSRARNIHKASKLIMLDFNGIFPKSSSELLKLPGIGPYTSRAISSICFGERVGVVDGNVLRVHNRLLGESLEWWKGSFFKETQKFSDKLVENGEFPDSINQAIMDLGATVCTPKNPSCLLCPLKSNCLSQKRNLQNNIPLPKPKKKFEIWNYVVYQNTLKSEKLKVYNIHPETPVLKNNPLPYGNFKKLERKPSDYSFIHTITHHKIYITFQKAPSSSRLKTENFSLEQLKKATPSSLIEKIWQSPKFHEKI